MKAVALGTQRTRTAVQLKYQAITRYSRNVVLEATDEVADETVAAAAMPTTKRARIGQEEQEKDMLEVAME